MWGRLGFLRALSEYVSAILLTLIVLAVGASLVAYTARVIDERYAALNNMLEEALLGAYAGVAVTAAYINDTSLILVVANGDIPVSVEAVYVNESLAVCRAAANAAEEALPYTLRPYEIAVVRCDIGSSSEAIVKLVTSAGDVVVRAGKV